MKRKPNKNKHKNRQFVKTTMRLKDNHTWTAPDGYKVVVIDRGAVSFNIPESWLLVKMEPLEIHDGAPPNDNARLMVTVWHMPPGIDWTGLPLAPLLMQATEGTRREILEQTGPTPLERDDIEFVWLQQRFVDEVEKREAFSRIAVARGWNIHLLITFDFWVDDLKRCEVAWNEVLRSLQMGRVISDPTQGPVLH
jgi:hypothetical protein